jgi:MFS family permease
MTAGTGADSAQAAGIRQTWHELPGVGRALLFGSLINRLGGFLQVFAVLYMTSLGYSATRAAGALAAYSAGSIAGMAIGGALSDTLGGRRVIVASMSCYAVLLLGTYYVDSYTAKIVAVTLAGAMSQAYRPAATNMLSELAPKPRQLMVFAMNRLAVNLGATAMPLVGVLLASVSYGLLFWTESAAALGYALLAAAALEPHARRPDIRQRTGYRAVFADRRYAVFLAGLLVHSLVYVQYLVILPLSILRRGMPMEIYGVLIALNGLTVVTCELWATKRVQRLPVSIAVIGGMLLTGLGMCGYAPRWGVAGLLLATLVWTSGEMVGAPTIYFAHPAQAAPPHLRGAYLGAANAIFGLGNTLGPLIGILAWTALGDGAWWLCGAAGLAAASLGWYGSRLAGFEFE